MNKTFLLNIITATRAALEAGIMVLRKTRYHASENILENLIA
jgi:hypothetical protein